MLRWTKEAGFLVFLPKRRFHLAYHQYFFVLSPAQKGVPWNPRNPPPPKSATSKFSVCAARACEWVLHTLRCMYAVLSDIVAMPPATNGILLSIRSLLLFQKCLFLVYNTNLCSRLSFPSSAPSESVSLTCGLCCYLNWQCLACSIPHFLKHLYKQHCLTKIWCWSETRTTSVNGYLPPS